jgi:tetratricopeptide (TPR) repeat protein
MRAAIRVQEARGRALSGEDAAAQHLLDQAHTWAASDATGDARDGHGSFCTPSYIEIHRANCLTVVGQPTKAITLYEQALPTMPTVYQRDRAAGLSGLAAAYVLDRQPEQAASIARIALPAARGAGSRRIVQELQKVGVALEPHRELASVGALLHDLHQAKAQ